MTDWTREEDEAFNDVEKQSNLGKQILKDMDGQPYNWEANAIDSAIRIEREACAELCDLIGLPHAAELIRYRGKT